MSHQPRGTNSPAESKPGAIQGAEGQPVVGVGAGLGGATTPMAAAPGQRGLLLSGPGVGHLGDEVAEVLPGDAGEARMGQGRTGSCGRSHPVPA